jgi:hypothetical protein
MIKYWLGQSSTDRTQAVETNYGAQRISLFNEKAEYSGANQAIGEDDMGQSPGPAAAR